MIFTDPYSIKTLKLVNTTDTILNINKYIALDYAYISLKEKTKLNKFVDERTVLTPVFLYGLSDIEKEITPFNHPLISLEHKWIACDLRSVVSLSNDKQDFEIRNRAEYNLLMQRFILTGLWATGKQSSLYSLKFAHFVFASWLAENISKKFGLDLGTQFQLRILGLIYYAKLFTNDYTEDDHQKLLVRLKEDIVVPKLVEEVYEKLGKLENIDDFCRECYNITSNVRLKGLDINVLINLLANNWFGLNGKEVILLSLEHPPTWISLVYAALTEKAFNKNFVTNLVEKLDKKGKGMDFLKAMSHLTQDVKKE